MKLVCVNIVYIPCQSYLTSVANIDEFISFIAGIVTPLTIIRATGGGSIKFKSLFKERLGLDLQPEDEMECLTAGLNFLVHQIAYQVFSYDERRADPMVFETSHEKEFPYLLVNVGSGVSIIKVTSAEKYERVSGNKILI